MFKKSEKGYYFWEEFANVDGIIHGFSTRRFGDMNWKNQNSIKNLRLFCDALQIKPNQTVRMEQVHGNNVKVVDYRTSLKGDSGQARMTWIASTDGLISSQKNVFLLVTFADCVPVLFLDKNKKIFGLAHAGWRGVYKEIVKVMVSKMVNKGCDPKKIRIGIGPSIRVCCYNVSKDRADAFKAKFPQKERVIKIKDGKLFLDLIKIVKLQLKDCGILERNILDCQLCTKDNILDFYSFRKEGGTESFGLSCGVIGRMRGGATTVPPSRELSKKDYE